MSSSSGIVGGVGTAAAGSERFATTNKFRMSSRSKKMIWLRLV